MLASSTTTVIARSFSLGLLRPPLAPHVVFCFSYGSTGYYPLSLLQYSV